MNKRGLSPIVATILLIAFAVAIGAMIMSWTAGLVKEAPTCEDIPTEIISSDKFCKLTNKVVPKVEIEEGTFEACKNHALILSELKVC
ncbi:hypothetical protein CMO90_01735 [Candidatus Woesearchaeota archaeon]|jgi:flagellin-like protein|nr:hypothetical protein [Candidatus Woesearchaeota archaeon]